MKLNQIVVSIGLLAGVFAFQLTTALAGAGDIRDTEGGASHSAAAARAAAERIAAENARAAEATERARIQAENQKRLHDLQTSSDQSEAKLKQDIDDEFKRLREEWNQKLDKVKTDTITPALVELLRGEMKDAVDREIKRKLTERAAAAPAATAKKAAVSETPPPDSGSPIAPLLGRFFGWIVSPEKFEEYYETERNALVVQKKSRVEAHLMERSLAFEIEKQASSSHLVKAISQDLKIQDLIKEMNAYALSESAAAAAEL